MDKIFEEVRYVIIIDNEEIGLGHAGNYDTTSPHIWCRTKLIEIANRISSQDKIATIKDLNKTEEIKVYEIEDFIDWIINKFEHNQTEFYGFSNYVKSEIKNN
jgi:hypothetical protein